MGEPGHRPGTGAARFDGQGSFLEVADHPALQWGTRGFTIAGWVHTDAEGGDAVGDLVAKFDPDTRTGVHLGILTSTGMTSTAGAAPAAPPSRLA